MEIKYYKKLEETIRDQSFHKSYANINKVMFVLSIFGHLSSILLAYFLVSKILSGAITDNPILVGIASVILLSGLELLKRDIFDKFSLQYLKAKELFKKDVLPLLTFSVMIISISFYCSISGAKEFANKSTQIEVKNDITNKSYEDSLNLSYNNQIQGINSDIILSKTKIEDKDKEQTQLEASDKFGKKQKDRIKDLKDEQNTLREDIIKYQANIDTLKKEESNKIQEYESKNASNVDKQKSDNKTNSFFFVIISSMIEFIILAGVYFNKYYKVRSYNDFKEQVEKDPKYQKWILYDSILDIIYSEDTKLNDKLPTIKNIIDLCRINGTNLFPKDMENFFKVISSLKIVKSSGPSKYFLKDKESAKETIKSHFNIK